VDNVFNKNIQITLYDISLKSQTEEKPSLEEPT
jgi:hypothetical protein